MASKIPESEWSAVIARRESGETVASIARSYDCSPALVYGILKRHENAAPATPERLLPDIPPSDDETGAEAGDEPADPVAESAVEAVYEEDGGDDDDGDSDDGGDDDEGDDEQDEVASKPPALAARLDADLRQDAEAAIRAFAAAFDAALTPASGVKDREELHTAASALMRAGARTIIVLERFGAPSAPVPVRQAPRSNRRGAAPHAPSSHAPAPHAHAPRAAVPPAGPSPAGALPADTPHIDAGATPGAAAQAVPIPAGSVEGTVKWFKPAKRFGFIAVAGGEDVFVHAQALERSGLSGLQQGQRVRLTISAGAKGPQADRIELI